MEGALKYCHTSPGICDTACLCLGHIPHGSGKHYQFQSTESFKQGEEKGDEEKANDSE